MKLTSIALRLFVQIKEAAEKKVFWGGQTTKKGRGETKQKIYFSIK